MLCSKLLRQLRGSWPKMPSLHPIQQGQDIAVSKWRQCSDTWRTPWISEIRCGLTRKARANWQFITWRTQQKALSGDKSMTAASSHVFWRARPEHSDQGVVDLGASPQHQTASVSKHLHDHPKCQGHGFALFCRPVSNRSPLYPDVPGAKKMNDLVVWFCYVFGLYGFAQLQQLCDHLVMGWK